MEAEFYRGDCISNVLQMESRVRKRWTAIVHHAGNGCRLHDSFCLARIYSDGLHAIVVLTELRSNKGTSVTNAYELIAGKLQFAVQQFILQGNFPSNVTWLEQYEDRPENIDLVTLRWQENRFASPPSWKAVSRSLVENMGLDWADVVTIPEGA